MPGLSRRRLPRAGSAMVTAALAGRATSADKPEPTSPRPTGDPTGTDSPLTDWTSSTDCEGEPDGMHTSVIRVERVTTGLDADEAPIQFPMLSAAERATPQTVTEEGGYATCDASDAFDRFVDRVRQHVHGQSADVYLERHGTYYRPYVEVLDQVVAYRAGTLRYTHPP